MAVLNVHERRLPVPPSVVGALLDTLASEDDRLWPDESWPAMRLDRGLAPGAAGGHGPIRYEVAHHVPGQWVRFVFTAPAGFEGFHEFTVRGDTGGSVLRHTLAMRTHAMARVSWPLLFRPLHDVLIEDSLAKALAEVGGGSAPVRWTPLVRGLRRLLARFASGR